MDTSGILMMQYDGFVSESAGAKDTWGVNSVQIQGEQGYIYIKDGSTGIAEVKVVTKTSEETYNEQENIWPHFVGNSIRKRIYRIFFQNMGTPVFVSL